MGWNDYGIYIDEKYIQYHNKKIYKKELKEIKNNPAYCKNPWGGFKKRVIIGIALNTCKKGQACLVEVKAWNGKELPTKLTELQLAKKNIKEKDMIYYGDIIATNTICKIFTKIIKELNLTPVKLGKFLIQKHNTEKIINS